VRHCRSSTTAAIRPGRTTGPTWRAWPESSASRCPSPTAEADQSGQIGADPSSGGQIAPVDVEGNAGDEAGQVAGQEEDGAGRIVRRAVVADGRPGGRTVRHAARCQRATE